MRPPNAPRWSKLFEPMRDPRPVFWDRKAYRSASWRLWGKRNAIGSSPGVLARSAYMDKPVLIGHGQTISQPFIVALMTHLAAVKFDDTVLEVGTGSGYQAAVLARLVRKVCTIEIIPPLAEAAAKVLRELGYDNVSVKVGDGYLRMAGMRSFRRNDRDSRTRTCPAAAD